MTKKNRIDLRFEQLRERGEQALVPFLTAGDPDLETTEQLILAIVPIAGFGTIQRFEQSNLIVVVKRAPTDTSHVS